jgi:capping protein (actin filament) muscle Z-line, beta
MADAQFDASLDLLRRLPPNNIPTSLSSLTTLLPSLTEDLLSSVDAPLSTATDPSSNRPFLLCDYNRDTDSYRSPWSNKFYPPLPSDIAAEATYPSERIRNLEVELNTAFDVYRQMYYEGGISSIYLWDQDDGFAGVVLLKKTLDGTDSAGWDSIHVFEVDERRTVGSGGQSKSAHYKLTSTVILHLAQNSSSAGSGGGSGKDEMTLAGSMTRQLESTLPLTPTGSASSDNAHTLNIGRLVEDMEGKMRNLLQEVYFGKAKDVVGDLRSIGALSGVNAERRAQREVIGSMGGAK